MLTFGGQDFQYFRVGLFDFHRARAPDRLLDIGKLSASNPAASKLTADRAAIGQELPVVAGCFGEVAIARCDRQGPSIE